MRKLCPNLDREDGLETVLEVPIPEEMFAAGNGKSHHNRAWQNVKSWMRPTSATTHQTERSIVAAALFGGRSTEIQLLLGVVGAPLIPLPIQTDHDEQSTRNIKDHPIVSIDPLIPPRVFLKKKNRGRPSDITSMAQGLV